MSQPFVAEIRMCGFNFAPRGWAFCRGQLLPISQNTALFSLLGTTYGGNGTSNFALPNLQDSAVVGKGDGPNLTPRVLGETGGQASVTLLPAEVPPHTHAAKASLGLGNQPTASGNVIAKLPTNQVQFVPITVTNPPPAAYGNGLGALPAGGGLAHNNMQPYLAVNFIICMQGVFPARN